MAQNRADWPKLIASGLVGGTVINAIEWAAHRIWLHPDWSRAFTALGKTPIGWSSFIFANFAVGVLAVWTYRWLSKLYGRGASTGLRAALAIWIIFWVIPILGLQPMDLFPNSLLAWVVAVGVLDGVFGTLPAIWLYAWMTRGRPREQALQSFDG